MNELEKLRIELEEIRIKLLDTQENFHRSMDDAMRSFRVAILKAREIERQAGIGEEK